MSGDMSLPPSLRLPQSNREPSSLAPDSSASRIKKIVQANIPKSQTASLQGHTASVKENAPPIATALTLLGVRSTKTELASALLFLKEAGHTLPDKKFEEACNTAAKSLAEFALREPNEREFFLQCKTELLVMTPKNTAENKSTHLHLKVAEHILNHEPPSTESFATRVLQLATKFAISDKMAVKEAAILGCTPEVATLFMLNRVYNRRSVLNPNTPTHSPSIARKAEQTGFSPSLIRTIEKGFSRYLKQPETAPTKIAVENVTVYYHGSGEVLVEQKELDSGGFKVINIALDYFSGIEESDSDVVTAKPRDRKEATASSMVEEDDSFARFDPNAEESRGSFRPLSFSDSPAEPDSGFRSMVFNEAEEPVAEESSYHSMVFSEPEEPAIEPTAANDVTRALEGHYPLKDLTLSEMKEYRSHLSDTTEIDLLIAKRESDIERQSAYKPLSREENYARELELTLQLQGPGVVRVRKVVELEHGNKMVVMDRAGYTLEPVEGLREKPTTVINLDHMVQLYHKKKLAPDEVSQLVQMCSDAIQSVANLHDQGYIHRDLKALNILVSKAGKALLSDFGTTVQEQGDPEKIYYSGTVYFSAPESFMYENSERWDNLTKASDVWSLGMMLQDIFMPGGLPAHHAIEKTTFDFALMTKYKSYEEPEKQAAYEDRYKEPADKNSLEHLIWSATRLDPAQRPTIHEFLTRFNRVKDGG